MIFNNINNINDINDCSCRLTCLPVNSCDKL